MKRKVAVNLGNLLLSISDAVDLASPRLMQHQQRVAFAAWEMAKAARIPDQRIERGFVAAILHDIGAFSLEDKIAVLGFESDEDDAHVVHGARLLKDVGCLSDSSDIVRYHHRKWSDWHEGITAAHVLETQILTLADHLERRIDRDRFILRQHEAILSDIRSLSGTTFHPDVVDLLMQVSGREEFWFDLVSPRLYSLLLTEGPYRKIETDLAGIVQISTLFRNMIDFKSRFTATHSSGVAAAASLLARMFGLSETEVGLIEVAGNLHDLGKLVIPNAILDKPGPLLKEETAFMKSHTYFTYSILNTVGGLRQIAEWAAYHHERLDGSGYPFHRQAEDLDTGARIMMVADLFTALVENRPYRQGMAKAQAMSVIEDLGRRELLDPGIVELAADNYQELQSHVSDIQATTRNFYEKTFGERA